MKTPFNGFLRRLLAGSALLAFSTVVSAVEYYATVSGAGLKNGSSWSNAFDQAGIQSAVNNLNAGDALNIGSGTYNGLSISITSGGTAGSPKTIRGVDTGSGRPTLASTRAGTSGYDNQATTSNAFTFVGSTSAAIRWVNLENFFVRNYGAAVLFKSPDTRSGGSDELPRFPSRECFSDIIIDDVDGTEVYLGMMFVQATRVSVMDCDFIRLGFRGFSMWSYCTFMTFDRCTAQGLGLQSNGQPDTVSTWVMNSVPTGFYTTDCSPDGEINNITYIECVARRFLTNNGNSGSTAYWNGDGFTSEENSYNFTYIRCWAFENEDGGFDDKAASLVMDGCVALKNKRGFRYHAAALPEPPVSVPGLTSNATYRNCFAGYSFKRGGSSSLDGFWIANDNGAPTSTVVYLENCTAHDNPGAGVNVEFEAGIAVEVTDSILSTTLAGATNANLYTNESGTSLTIASSTATYRPGAGSNPNYSAPSADWLGSPATAFNSQLHGSAKGYHSANVGSGGGGGNSVPSITTTSLPGATVSTAYSQTLAASGGDGALVWTVSSGALPAGLALSSAGVISGTPTTAGTANFTVKVADSDGVTGSTDEDTQALSLLVSTGNSVPSITTASLPGATVSTAYSQTLAATGGNGALVWSVASGSLPAGLALSSAGVISGTPTTAGTANFTVKVADSDGVTGATDEDTQALSLVVAAAGGSPTTVSFQDGVSSYAGTTDATIKSGSATTNFGSAATLEPDGDPDQAALLRFDLSSIATNKTVTAVTLTFNVTNNSSDSYEIYALKRAFAEGSATWNVAQTGTNWQTAGASGANDRETTALGAISAASGSTVTVTLNASGIAKVQSWVSTPAGNYGFVILDYAAGDGLDLRSSETSTATQRPKLTVTYQ